MIQDKARKAAHPAGYAKATKRRPSPRPNPYAICQVVRDGEEKAVLINAAKPTGYSLCSNICPECHLIEYKSGVRMSVAYAHTRNSKGHCDECEGDRIAAIGIALERQGINLGWGVMDHTREYEREAYNINRLARLQSDAKEV